MGFIVQTHSYDKENYALFGNSIVTENDGVVMFVITFAATPEREKTTDVMLFVLERFVYLITARSVNRVRMEETSQYCSTGPNVMAVIGADCLIMGD